MHCLGNHLSRGRPRKFASLFNFFGSSFFAFMQESDSKSKQQMHRLGDHSRYASMDMFAGQSTRIFYLVGLDTLGEFGGPEFSNKDQ